jgi:hypothetical protein
MGRLLGGLVCVLDVRNTSLRMCAVTRRRDRLTNGFVSLSSEGIFPTDSLCDNVVDIVTSRHANLHDDLMALLGHSTGFTFPTPPPLYATAYRPAHREERNEIDLWRESLAAGEVLPTLPLAVRGLGCLPIDLEATYVEARKRGRVG